MEFLPITHYDIQIERDIIGAIMLEQFAFSRVSQYLKADYFYYDEHKVIYSAFVKMKENLIPVDIITTTHFLHNSVKVKTLFDKNVPYYLASTQNRVISCANLEFWAVILFEQYQRRELLRIKFEAIEDENNISENVTSINKRLYELTSTTFKKDWENVSELVIKLYEHQEKMAKTKGIGLRIGFSEIDNNTGGLFGGQFIFIAARPSIGKSALALTIARTVAKQGTSVGIISLEMPKVENIARIISIDTQTDFSIVYRGLFFDERERQTFHQKVTNDSIGLPIFISDNTDVNIYEIKAKAERLKLKENCGLLIIDYLQLVGTDESKYSTREREIAKISRMCKIMAKELEIPVIALGQLNRDVTKRKGQERYPILTDIRESDTIGQDADAVIFLHSDFKSGFIQDENGNSTENNLDLVIRKWRQSKSDYIVPCRMIPKLMQVVENENSSVNLQPFQSFSSNDDPPF